MVQMVLCGKVNKDLVATLDRRWAAGPWVCAAWTAVCSRPRAASSTARSTVWWAMSSKSIRRSLTTPLPTSYIPVISTVARGVDGESSYNINADTAAAQIAVALGAEKLILLTDTRGLLRDVHDESTLISEVRAERSAGAYCRGRDPGRHDPEGRLLRGGRCQRRAPHAYSRRQSPSFDFDRGALPCGYWHHDLVRRRTLMTFAETHGTRLAIYPQYLRPDSPLPLTMARARRFTDVDGQEIHRLHLRHRRQLPGLRQRDLGAGHHGPGAEAGAYFQPVLHRALRPGWPKNSASARAWQGSSLPTRGAEANEGMLKVARKYSSDKLRRRPRHDHYPAQFLPRQNDDHPDGHGPGPCSTNISIPFPTGYRYAPANDLAALEQAAGGDVCAVMMELVQGEGGVQPAGRRTYVRAGGGPLPGAGLAAAR